MVDMSASIRYRFGRFELQPEERRLLADGVAVHFGPHAFSLLVSLVERAGHLITKQELLAHVWPGVIVEENSLQAQISALRKTVGTDAIATVSGQGYRFALPVLPVTEAAMGNGPPQNRLQQSLTSFIGREKEIAEIRQGLGTTRLLTLTGAGGCGKTRLALQVASTMQDEYPDGVRFVELAPLGDPALVVQAVAKALSVATPPGRDIVEAIIEWLASQRLLLVLDNAEHVLDACASLVDALLRRCVYVVIIATSRERLGIDGELTFRVPSLSVPDGDVVEDIQNSEAVRLFIDRARLRSQDFAPSGKDMAAIASVCRRLDGIALAIELAAPQVRMMSLEDLNARLDDRFALLKGGARTALPRHRTLRSLIDWSHDLLSRPEQILLRRLSVFAGGWTLEGAEQICSGDGIARSDILDLLGSLEDKNLVVAEVKGQRARFTMLETVREYGQQQSGESGDATAVLDRLTDYLTKLATGLDAPQDSTLLATLHQLDAEHDNVRVALVGCERDPAYSLKGLRLAAGLFEFWRIRGWYSEGLAWLARLQAAVLTGERDETHALALHAMGALLGVASDQAAAATCLREAIELWQQLGDRRQSARTLLYLSYAEWYSGHAAPARAACAEALAIAREFGDQRTVADTLNCFAGMACLEHDYDEGLVLLDECLTVSRGIGPWATAAALDYLGGIEFARGDYARARSLWRESFVGHRQFGEREGICAVLSKIAVTSMELGEVHEATSGLRDTWAWLPAGNHNELLYWLGCFAELLLACDAAADAARVWGCVERHREERGLERPPSKHQKRKLDAARSALHDDAAFERAWSKGRSWSLDEAKRFARDFYDGLPGDQSLS
jgi:predicted ATPase/DNA-binding winged helix-turn-helix (wHTH) protein